MSGKSKVIIMNKETSKLPDIDKIFKVNTDFKSALNRINFSFPLLEEIVKKEKIQ